jgi:hypothetical protein
MSSSTFYIDVVSTPPALIEVDTIYPQGPQGPTGPAGVQGPQGIQGPSGADTPHHVNHDTGGSDAIAALSAAVLTTGTVPNARLDPNVVVSGSVSAPIVQMPERTFGSLPGSYASLVVADGALAYWRLGETSGLSFADASGNAKTATVTASTGFTYAVPGVLADGDKGLGVAGTQSIATFSAIAVGTTCTIEFWMVGSNLGSGPYCNVIGAVAGGAGVYHNPSTGKINCQTGADHFNMTALAIGVQYHVVISITAGNGTFYLNGVPDGTFTGWPGQTLGALFNNGGGSLVTPLVDEIAIYPTALTAPQIAAHYTARTLQGIPLGTLANISDSTIATIGGTIAGGGTNHVLGRYNGTVWKVIG